MRHKIIYGLMVAVMTIAMLPLQGMTEAQAGKKTKTLLGIAVGVAAGALILNEVSKANEKKHRKKHHHKKKVYKKKTYHKKTYNKPKKVKKAKVHCHANGKRHYHNEFQGTYLHAHEPEEGCGSYRLNKKYNDGPGTGAYKPKNVNTQDPWKRCQQDFASFSGDGTYQPNGNGPRKLCPYL